MCISGTEISFIFNIIQEWHLTVFTAITLQNYLLRCSSGELGSKHTKNLRNLNFFRESFIFSREFFDHSARHFFHFCYWAELESLHFVLHRLYFRNFPRNWRCKQMIFLVLAHSSILQHSVSTGHPWCVHVLSLLLSLHLSDNNQSKLWSTWVRLLQQHHEMQMSIRRPSRVDVQLPQR